MATAEPDSAIPGAEEVPELDLAAKIIKQVEFYFGDKNLPRDKFLLRILHEEGNEPGWVPLNTLLDFNRLKKLTMDTTLIATALKQSTSGLLEVSEDNTKVRRLTTIPDINENLLFEPEKTVYAKGFPLDITIDDLESFFESFGKITIIRRRTFPNKTFKGSVFVEFADESFATQFVKTDDVKYKETDLIRMMRNDYTEKKALEKQEYKKNARLEKSQKLRESVQNENPFLKGALLKLEGFPNTTKREEVKKLFPENTVKFIDMNMGDVACVVMFCASNGAVDSLKEIQTEESTLKFDESIVNYKLLDGEEEQNEWVRLSQFINDKFTKNKKRDRSFKGGQGARRGGKRGRDSRKFQGKRFGKFERVPLGKRKIHEDTSSTKTDETVQPKMKHIRLVGSDED